MSNQNPNRRLIRIPYRTSGASERIQLIPATAKRYGVLRMFDPHENVLGGARYLKDLLDRFDVNPELASAGYNAGENAVR